MLQNQSGYIVFYPTRGGTLIVDGEDRHIIDNNVWTWEKNSASFINQAWIAEEKRTHRVSLSRFLMKAKPSQVVDHINGNTLDNRRCNLRVCAKAQNNINKTKTSGVRSSKYKGVFWENSCNRWRVQIRFEGVRKHVGVFKDEIAAAEAYDKFARKLHGEFACVNFPKQNERGALI